MERIYRIRSASAPETLVGRVQEAIGGVLGVGLLLDRPLALQPAR